jgi:hypothetical protein
MWMDVDLFFVVSGFLVCLLFRKYHQCGQIRLGRFLIRRGFYLAWWPRRRGPVAPATFRYVEELFGRNRTSMMAQRIIPNECRVGVLGELTDFPEVSLRSGSREASTFSVDL